MSTRIVGLAAYALAGLLQTRSRAVETEPGEPVGPQTTTALVTPAPTSPTGPPADAPGERVAA